MGAWERPYVCFLLFFLCFDFLILHCFYITGRGTSWNRGNQLELKWGRQVEQQQHLASTNNFNGTNCAWRQKLPLVRKEHQCEDQTTTGKYDTDDNWEPPLGSQWQQGTTEHKWQGESTKGEQWWAPSAKGDQQQQCPPCVEYKPEQPFSTISLSLFFHFLYIRH